MKSFLNASVFFVLLASACQKESPVTINKFADPVFIKIHDFQDRRLSDSLYQYFENQNKLYRRDAVLAFASIQDSIGADRIGILLLNDTVAEIRKAAAFALGQIQCRQSELLLLNALERKRRMRF